MASVVRAAVGAPQTADTRERIVSAACALAARKGLDAVSFATLATLTGMTKSGVFACFGSRDAVLTEILDACGERFRRQVVLAPRRQRAGLRRLEAMFVAGIAFLRRERWLARLLVLGPGRACPDSAPVQARLAAFAHAWRSAFLHAAEQCRACGHLAPETDCAQLVFELSGLAFQAGQTSEDEAEERRVLRAFYRLTGQRPGL